jgi:GNAT superfamily N-acetyltransferase
MANAEIQIREAGVGEAAVIARLLHDFNTEYEEPSPGIKALTEHSGQLLGADEMTVLLAGAGPDGISLLRFRPSVWTGEPEAHLQELYVVPPLRGRGIGRRLLEANIELARRRGATNLDLNTGETDAAARALYESMGFTNKEGGPEGPSMLFYEREI